MAATSALRHVRKSPLRGSFSKSRTQRKEYLGIAPQSAINVLWSYVRSGLPVSMVLGQTVYGKWRWVVKSFSIKMKHTDKNGTWTHCTVSVNLMEYLAQ